MVGALARQALQAPGRFDPRLPETFAVRQAVQAVVLIETRLLQRLLARLARDALRRLPTVIVTAPGDHQAG